MAEVNTLLLRAPSELDNFLQLLLFRPSRGVLPVLQKLTGTHQKRPPLPDARVLNHLRGLLRKRAAAQKPTVVEMLYTPRGGGTAVSAGAAPAGGGAEPAAPSSATSATNRTVRNAEFCWLYETTEPTLLDVVVGVYGEVLSKWVPDVQARLDVVRERRFQPDRDLDQLFNAGEGPGYGGLNWEDIVRARALYAELQRFMTTKTMRLVAGESKPLVWRKKGEAALPTPVSPRRDGGGGLGGPGGGAGVEEEGRRGVGGPPGGGYWLDLSRAARREARLAAKDQLGRGVTSDASGGAGKKDGGSLSALRALLLGGAAGEDTVCRRAEAAKGEEDEEEEDESPAEVVDPNRAYWNKLFAGVAVSMLLATIVAGKV